MKRISIIALTLILAMVLGTFAVSAAPTKEFSLIPGADATWTDIPNGGVSVTTEHKEDGTVVFAGSVSGTWPCIEHWYAEPIVANVETDSLVIDMNVASGNTNINLFFQDNSGNTYGYTLCNSMFADRNYDSGSGDLMADDYVVTISLKDFVATTKLLDGSAFPAGAIVDGTLKFCGIQVYSVNGAVITVKKLAVACVVDRPAVEHVDGCELPVTGTDVAANNADGQVIYYAAGDEDRVLTADEFNFRYSYILVVDKDGKIVEVGNNLLTNAQDSGNTFQNEFTVPAGGFAISFFYNGDNTANQALFDVYASITGQNVDSIFAIYNETVAVNGGNYVVTCDGENLKVSVGNPGDAGVLVFAVLAMVALAGLAVVTKTRKEF